MKRFWTLLLAGLLFCSSAWAESAFSAEELIVGSLKAGAGVEEAVAAFGEPSAVETLAAEEALETVYCYEGLALTFRDGALCGAEWTQQELPGPRGLTVGVTEQNVKNAFLWDKSQKESAILYTAGTAEGLDVQLPPCGVVGLDESGATVICYEASMKPNDEQDLAEPMAALQREHAVLRFTLSPGGTVERIRWQVAVLMP